MCVACQEQAKIPIPPVGPGPGPGPSSYTDYPNELTSAEAARKKELDGSYDPSKNLLKSGALLSSTEYVVLLYKEGGKESIAKADLMLNTIMACQNKDINSTYYGVWPWYPDKAISDRNASVFFARRMLGQLWEQQEKMSTETKNNFVLACQRLVYAAEHRFDEEIWAENRSDIAYTNVFCLYLETMTLAAKRYNEDRYKRLASKQWERFYNHFSVHGIDEFLSAGYDDVSFSALLSVYHNITDNNQKKEVKEVMDYIYTLEAAVTHPILNTQVVGISRDNRVFRNGSDARCDIIKSIPEGYVPPSVATDLLKNKKYPFEIEGRAGALTFTFKSYQLQDAAMGSMTGWGNYYSQQIHCMASVGKSTSQRATLFVPGSYIHVNGFTDQKELSTLCVYNRLPTMWHVMQWGGNLNNINDTFFNFGIGLSTQFASIRENEGDIVYRAWGYDFHIRPFYIENGKVKYCKLNKVHRKESSPKYHRTDMEFDELAFPTDKTWFGAYISLTKENQNITLPTISYKEVDGLYVFTSSEGHSIKVAKTDPGVYVHARDVDPYSKPRYIIN